MYSEYPHNEAVALRLRQNKDGCTQQGPQGILKNVIYVATDQMVMVMEIETLPSELQTPEPMTVALSRR